MKANVIGVSTGTYEKDGQTREASQIYVEIPFKEFESNRDGMTVLGKKTMQCYLGKKVDCKPGDEVYLEFEPGFQDKAQLVGVEVIGKARGGKEEATK